MRDLASFSLLSTENSVYHELSDNTANDLSIDYIVGFMTRVESERIALTKLLRRMPTDEQTVRYRHEIYSDLRANPGLSQELYTLLDEMRFASMLRTNALDSNASIWELIRRMKELETYSQSIVKLHDILSRYNFSSKGFCELKETIVELYNKSAFKELCEDVQELGSELSLIKSMTIGVNFDSSFGPAEVGIVSLNRYWFERSNVLNKFIGHFQKEDPDDNVLNSVLMKMHPTNFDGSASPLMNNLTSIIQKMVPHLVTPFLRILRKYTNLSAQVIVGLADELMFYARFYDLEMKLRELGVPVCMPQLGADDTVFGDMYNLRLAAYKLNGGDVGDIVCNDVGFSGGRNVLILTGPNRGGKTILTQGLGLAFLLAQHGVFVPARSAAFSLCDGIYTHFPAEEEETLSLGRLGEESERFAAICRCATGRSLLLFNESFYSTSYSESLFIARDALRYICCLGARTLFNTHMFELAEHCESLSDAPEAVCSADSLVMGTAADGMQYKISRRKPDGTSFAREVAHKYGISFDQLMENLSKDVR